jgi:ribosomal protein L11 methyltransferase
MRHETEQRLPTVVVEVAPIEADIAAAQLMHFGADSVETRDATTLVKGGALGVTLVAHFTDETQATECVEAFAPHAQLRYIEGDDWADAWKKHWKPTRLGDRLVVVPSWVEYTPEPADLVLRLDPGRAFGTGQHESTALAVAALERVLLQRQVERVFDVGCGSGILSFAALKFGARSAVGCDTDRESVEVARENAALLSLSDVEFFVGGCDDRPVRAPVVVANIEAGVLVPLADRLAQHVAPGGRLILSGILAVQRDEVVSRYHSLGLILVRCDQRGEWVAPEFDRPAER